MITSERKLLDPGERLSGPMWIRNDENRMEIRFHFHGFPNSGGSTWFKKSNVMDSIAARLDSLAPNPIDRVAVVFSLGPHFTVQPVDIYEARLRSIKAALDRLFGRIPDAMVMILKLTAREWKTAYHIALNGEWVQMRMNKLLREILGSDRRIAIVDSWDLTIAMFHPLNVHPSTPIIQTYIDHILSYVCPAEKRET